MTARFSFSCWCVASNQGGVFNPQTLLRVTDLKFLNSLKAFVTLCWQQVGLRPHQSKEAHPLRLGRAYWSAGRWAPSRWNCARTPCRGRWRRWRTLEASRRTADRRAPWSLRWCVCGKPPHKERSSNTCKQLQRQKLKRNEDKTTPSSKAQSLRTDW